MPSATKIVLVTTCYNNVQECRRTVASVVRQSLHPDRYLLVDSSIPETSQEVAQLAAQAGAEYLWVPAEGVYAAMNRSLEGLPDDALVWFINSSDWLASPKSVETVAAHIFREKTSSRSWFIGTTLRMLRKGMSWHEVGRNGSDFCRRLRRGSIGFPHPSALMPVGLIKATGGFNTRYSIAADYELALRACVSRQEAHVVDAPLAIHVPGGLSYQRPVRYFREKSGARRQHLRFPSTVTSNLVALIFGIRSLLRRVGILREPSMPPAHRRLMEEDTYHFCGNARGDWPKCCMRTLDRGVSGPDGGGPVKEKTP